jgi:hypothetical protein
MHCGTEFDAPVDAGDGEGWTDHGSGYKTPASDGPESPGATADSGSTATGEDSGSTATGEDSGSTATGEDSGSTDAGQAWSDVDRDSGVVEDAFPGVADRFEDWLAPDGWLDDSLTVVVAIVTGIVVGPLVTFFVLFVTDSGWSLLVGLAAWLGPTVYLARKRTVYEAIRGGAYAVAAVLALVPLSFLVAGDGSLGNRFVGFLIFEVVVLVFAVPLFAVGKVVGSVGDQATE